jgi:hypothetical protein
MTLYPTSFFVWRATAGAYLYYTAVYNENGHVVKFINEAPPAGLASIHTYVEPFTHTVGVIRPASSAEATRLKFYDFTESSCVRLVEYQLAGANWLHREREVPILEGACIAALPREMTAAGIVV